MKLLFQAICVVPTQQEYIAIYNPNNAPVDLSNYYITDAWHTGSNTNYIYIANPAAGIPGGGAFFDFHIRFPAGATIAAHDTIAVAHQSAPRFQTSYGRQPAFEIAYDSSNDPAVPDMRPAFPGSVPGVPDSTSLTNGGESVVLYYWDGQSDLVTDVDYFFWGTNTGSYVVDKTGKSVDGPDADATPTVYMPDTPPASQIPVALTHVVGNAFRREDFNEGTQTVTGGNGVGGRDETSENLSVTWSSDKPAAPPFVKAATPVNPIADAGGPYDGTANAPISFDGSGSTAPQNETVTSYAWNFGDGGTGAGITTTHTYFTAGSFTVVLTVTASGGGLDSDTTTATIAEPGAGGACPEDLVFWRRQCNTKGNAPTEVCEAGMDNLWQCVIHRTGVFRWQDNDSTVTTASLLSMTNAEVFAVMCDQLEPHPMTALDRAEMQYLSLALNVCSGALSPGIQVTNGFEGTVGSVLDSLANAINTGHNLHAWAFVATRVNRGMDLLTDECPNPDSLFSNMAPCTSSIRSASVKLSAGAGEAFQARAYPNPVAGGPISIEFRVPDNRGASDVALRIFDLSGRLIRTVLSEARQTGLHRVEWDLRDESGQRVPSGIYFCSVTIGRAHVTQKVLIAE